MKVKLFNGLDYDKLRWTKYYILDVTGAQGILQSYKQIKTEESFSMEIEAISDINEKNWSAFRPMTVYFTLQRFDKTSKEAN